MSRYGEQHGDYWITTGWDNPLQTFFAQVEGEDPDTLLLDIGGPFTAGSYSKIDAFANVLKETLEELGIDDYTLSDELKGRLVQDKIGC